MTTITFVGRKNWPKDCWPTFRCIGGHEFILEDTSEHKNIAQMILRQQREIMGRSARLVEAKRPRYAAISRWGSKLAVHKKKRRYAVYIRVRRQKDGKPVPCGKAKRVALRRK